MLKPGTKHAPLPADAGDASIARLDNLRNAKGNLRTAEIRRSMQKIMQNNAAVFRTQATLAEGVGLIDECVETFADVKVRVGGSLDRVSKLVIFIRPSCSRFHLPVLFSISLLSPSSLSSATIHVPPS